MVYKVALDAGHSESTWEKTGGKGLIYDNGKVFEEHHFNAAVTQYAKELAEQRGIKVILTQPLLSEKEVPLSERVQIAKREKVDLLISFHADANSNLNARGHWAFYWHTHEPSKRLAYLWDKYADRILPNPDRNVVESKSGTWTNFAMCREPVKYGIPSILLEQGFFTNKDDLKLLLDDGFRRKCAEVAVRAICEFLGITYDNIKPAQNEKVDTMPKVIKERIYADGGKLKYVPLDSGKPYSVSATDVRHIRFNPDQIEKVKFVYAKGKTVSQIAKEYGNPDYAFNFPFFYNSSLLGDAEDNDKLISAASGKLLKWHEFAYVNGRFVIGQLNKNDKQDFLVQGAPLLIENGNLVYEYYRKQQEVQDDIGLSRAQRTFVGVDANGGLILAVADGRTKSDRGLNLEEMALFMKDKGAIFALNGDGGGSSTFVEDGKILNANRNNERIVHHAIMVWLKKPTLTPTKGDENVEVVKVNFIENGEKTELEGLLKDGKTYVEVRKVAEEYDSSVAWDGTTKTVTIIKK